VISELVKNVMQACNLKQSDLAEVLGASLSRVKAITSGRVKNLTREENEALVAKLGIRPGWLIAGEGDMFAESLKNHSPVGAPTLTPDEAELLAWYRESDPAVKRTFKAALGAAASLARHQVSAASAPSARRRRAA